MVLIEVLKLVVYVDGSFHWLGNLKDDRSCQAEYSHISVASKHIYSR
jgi:hypothetical protein